MCWYQMEGKSGSTKNFAVPSRVSDYPILGLFFLSVTMGALVQIIFNTYVSIILPSHTSGSPSLGTTDILSQILFC